MDAPTGTLHTPTTLQAAIEFFADEDRCIAYLVQQRWPDGVIICPICNKPGPRYLANQRRFECKSKHPRRQFSVKVGTIFEDSPIPLKSWLLAMWQISNCKNGISSYELACALGVTQKSAWFMNHRIRLAMQDKTHGSGQFGLRLGFRRTRKTRNKDGSLVPRAKTQPEEGPDAARRFEDTVSRVLRVSKDELKKREAAYQKGREETRKAKQKRA